MALDSKTDQINILMGNNSNMNGSFSNSNRETSYQFRPDVLLAKRFTISMSFSEILWLNHILTVCVIQCDSVAKIIRRRYNGT